jgi:hypothetical protein
VSSFCIDRTQVHPAACHAQPIDSGMSHARFRCVIRQMAAA